MNDNIVRNKLFKPIFSLSLDKDELRRLLNVLQLRANAAAALEYKKFEGQNRGNLEQIKSELDICATLNVTVTSIYSEELFGTIEDVFNSVSFPEAIKSIYVNSELIYRTKFDYYPENQFQLFIDFFKPKIFDFSLQPSERTPNNSVFDVQGSDSTWVNGVFHEIDAYLKTKPSRFSKVHKGSIYDLFVWFLGIPFGFLICYKIINLNNSFLIKHSFVQNIFLTYCFFLTLFVFRILFHYFRWVYPMLEYRNKKNRSIAHQAALVTITLGLLGKGIYDIVKLLLTL